MKVDIYMPFFIGDYLRDTTDLTTEEHGAYLLILMSMWIGGGSLPEKKLAAVARVPSDRWPEVWATLSRFFVVTDGKAVQKRLADELARAEAKRETAQENGSRGGRPRTQTKPAGYFQVNHPANPVENPAPNPQETSSDPRSHLQISESESGASRPVSAGSEPDAKPTPEPTAPKDSDAPGTPFELVRLFGRLWERRWNLLFAQKQWDAKTADGLINGAPEAMRGEFKPAIEAFLRSEDPRYLREKHPFHAFARDFDTFRKATPKPGREALRLLPRLPPVDPNARAKARAAVTTATLIAAGET